MFNQNWSFLHKNKEDFDQIYLNTGSKPQNVEKLSLDLISKIISGKISKVLVNRTPVEIIHSQPDRNQSKLTLCWSSCWLCQY